MCAYCMYWARIQYVWALTCNPLNTESYLTFRTVPSHTPGHNHEDQPNGKGAMYVLYVGIYVYVRVCMCVYVCVCVCVCARTCMYILYCICILCTYVCLYVHGLYLSVYLLYACVDCLCVLFVDTYVRA